MLKLCKRQDGNMLILLMGVMAGFLALAVVFYDFVTVFAAKRIGQKAADAAALSAVQVWSQKADAAGAAEAQSKLKDFEAEMDAVVADQVSSWEVSEAQFLTATLTAENPGMSPSEIDQLVSDTIEAERPAIAEGYRDEYIDQHLHVAGLKTALRNHLTPAVEDAELEFISATRAGCIAHETAENARPLMQEAAKYFTEQNGSEVPASAPLLSYPVVVESFPRIQVTVAKRIQLGVFDQALDQEHRYLKVRAFSGISDVGPVRIQWSAGCGGI